jgi:hypothetical protein
MAPKPKALGIAAFGARGTGKTTWIVQLLQRTNPPRALVWDFKHDPGLQAFYTPITSIPALIKAASASRFQLRYLVDHTKDVHLQFEWFCRLVWKTGALVFVDELPEVTRAGKAPDAWRRIVNIGREYRGDDGKVHHITYIGAAQRPAEVDKSFISNADVIHAGRLAHVGDAKKLAEFMNCKYQDLTALADYHWIERRAGQIEPLRGVLPPPKTTAPAKKVASRPPAKRAA